MKRILLSSAATVLSLLLFAQERSFWTPVNESAINRNVFANRTRPQNFRLFQLRTAEFKTSLRSVPSERSVSSAASSFVLSIPDAEGRIERYRVVEAPVMHADLQARYPGIKSYAGKGIEDPASTIRFDVSPLGFHAIILSSIKPTIYIDPVDKQGDYYIVVSREDIIDFKKEFQCLTTEAGSGLTEKSGATLRNANDGKLRTYRLALCASGEYSQFWLDGTETSDAGRIAKVLAAQNNHMTRANAIFERDFGVRLVLVANNDAVIFLNASTDPWNSNNLNSATQTTCDTRIGSANYDIGHLVHRASNNGNAGCIACVCKAGSKGSGFTSYSNLTDNENFVVDYLTHEMGHQLGANHTFTFSNEGTIAQVEPGSGSTIMGYAGITGSTTDVQPHSDDYFHAISVQQVTDYIQSGSGGCATATVTNNTTPAVNAGSDYIIPRSTPFILTATATDADAGEALTFCWEQNDPRGTGFSTVPSATAASGPQFRSFKPVTTLARTFPEISSILSGVNSNKWEVLPSIARTLHFRFTARDNHSGGGANESDDMVLTISGTAGPFAVTAPNTAVNWNVGTTQTVSWSVNGTNGAPVNCTNVAILLSTDGGQTFPITLAASTANDGSELITVPNNSSTACRIKIAAIGNVFFDISNVNFAIGGTPSGCAAPAGLNTTAITAASATVSWMAVSGANSYDVDYKASSSSTWLVAATATTATSVNLSALQASTSYDWRVRANCVSSVSNYTSSGFTTTAATGACPGVYDVSTNGATSGAATIPLNTDIKGTISTRNDNDYYGFVITTGGTITLSLTTLPANYNLSLLNSAGNQIGSSQNNGTTDEAISATIAAGTYYARVFPKANASNASSCYTLKVATGTASRGDEYIIETNSKLGLALFPNPAKDVLNVVIDNGAANTELKVFDIYGRLVMQQKTSLATTPLSITGLSSGVYMIRVKKNDGASGNIKFVKE
jgi:hypothetical protein